MQAWKAKDVFHAYLDELFETSEGVTLSKEVRSSIYAHLNWESLKQDSVANESVTKALSSISKIQISVVYRSLFICAHAGHEQFIRDLLVAAATTISESNLVPNSLDADGKKILDRLYGHQIQLAGDGFRRYFEPLAHLRINYANVANAVVQSSQHDKPFLLEGAVLGFRVGNINREVIDQTFERFSCKVLWEKFADRPSLQRILKTSGKRETDKRVTEYLNEMLETRNRIAHTQGSFEMTKAELLQQIDFLKEISSFLHQSLFENVTSLLSNKNGK